MSNEAPKGPQTVAPDALAIWREQMGYSKQDAIDQLEISAADLQAWEAGYRPIPLHIGLAMAALAMGIGPFGAKE